MDFVPDDQRPYEAVARLRDALARGSHLVISHATGANTDPDTVKRPIAVYDEATAPAVDRDPAQIARFLHGLHRVHPGVVPLSQWRPGKHHTSTDPGGRHLLGGDGRKP